MNLAKLAGMTALIAFGCARVDDGPDAAAGAGGLGPTTGAGGTAAISDAGGNLGFSDDDANAPAFGGGSTYLTPDEINLFKNPCAAPIGDAGAELAAGSGACTYKLPAPSDPQYVIDPKGISVVVVTASGQWILYGRVMTSECSGGDAWYLDANMNVVLCPPTCATASSSGNELRIFAGCWERIVPDI